MGFDKSSILEYSLFISSNFEYSINLKKVAWYGVEENNSFQNVGKIVVNLAEIYVVYELWSLGSEESLLHDQVTDNLSKSKLSPCRPLFVFNQRQTFLHCPRE